MEVVKVPADNHDWKAINIFLFSNGQKNTPPRKYHLKSDELQIWEETLSFLANSQYGNEHSKIELYTIEGEKVENPLALEDGDAYVAVQFPGHFIQSGYSKYLLKASRSIDKRRKSQETPSSAIIQDNKNTISIASQENIKNNVSKKVEIKNIFYTKSNRTSNASHQPMKSFISTGSILKKNINSITGNPTAFSNKIVASRNKNANMDSNQRRRVSESANASIKKKTTVKSFLNPTNRNNSSSNQQNKLPLVVETESRNSKINISLTPDNKENQIKDADDKIKKILNSSMESTSHKKTISSYDISQKIEDRDKTLLETNGPIDVEVDETVNYLPIPPFQIFSSKKNISISEKSKIDNYLSVTNKSDYLNLQLCLEICRAENTVKTQNHEIKEALQSTPNEKTTDSEKIFKTDVDYLKVNEVPSLKSLLSVLINKEGSKVEVIQCACRESFEINEVFKLVAKPVCATNKTYIIVLPPNAENEIQKECRSSCMSCHKNIVTVDKSIQVSSTSGSSTYLKVESKKSLASLMTVEKQKRLDTSKCETIIKSESIQTNNSSCGLVQKISTISCVSQKNDVPQPELELEIKQNNTLGTSEKIEQTQWCGILLEARHQGSGHFTFHLPSLKKVKDLENIF